MALGARLYDTLFGHSRYRVTQTWKARPTVALRHAMQLRFHLASKPHSLFYAPLFRLI